MAQVIFFSGPIGSGKTTLGRAVAAQLGAAFLDGDDYSDHSKPWFASSLSTSRAIAGAALAASVSHRRVIVAYPLRCTGNVYYRRSLGDAGHSVTVVTLRTSPERIVAADRGRRFTAGEVERIAEMVAQGYADRPFSDLVVDTDAQGSDATVGLLVGLLQARLALNERRGSR